MSKNKTIMTIEEISKEILFLLDTEKYKTKEEFFAAFSKHLSIIATKAECIGDDRLTEALDLMREYLPKMECLSQNEKEELTEANKIVGFYIERFSDEGKEDEQMLKDEIHCACLDIEEKYEEYLKACDYARKKEMEYRSKYGEPSGMMNESFYGNMDEDKSN